MLSVLECLLVVVVGASQVSSFDGVVSVIQGGGREEAYKEIETLKDILLNYIGLIIRSRYNSSSNNSDDAMMMMDQDSDDMDLQLDLRPILPPSAAPDLHQNNNNYSVFYISPKLNTTTSSSTVPTPSAEFTQMVSIMAFFTIVMLAICAWILSKQCCFKDKSLRSSSSISHSGGGGDPVSRPRLPVNPQFNFLGVQVIRRLNNGNGGATGVDKPDDLPPCYEDLFPSQVPVTTESSPPLTTTTTTTAVAANNNKDVAITMTDDGSSGQSCRLP